MVNNSIPSSSTPSSSSLKPKPRRFKRCKSFIHKMGGCYRLLFGHLTKTFMTRKSFNEFFEMLYQALKEMLPSMAQADVTTMIANAIQKEHDNLRVEITTHVIDAITNHIPLQANSFDDLQMQIEDLAIWLSLKIKFERIITTTPCRPSAIHLKDQDDHHDDAHPKGEKKKIDHHVRVKESFYSSQEKLLGLLASLGSCPSISSNDWISIVVIDAITNHIPPQADSFDDLQLQIKDLAIWLSLKIKFERITTTTPCRPSAVRLKDQDDHHDDAHPKGENSAKRQKTSEYGTYFVHKNNLDEFDMWIDGFSTDDEVPTKEVSQELMDEVSEEVDEAKLRKVVDDMLRQRCTLGEEHQYHIDQMQNYLKNDIV
ncbi:hypothetical protein Tco_1281964 [Tanacetum coccineum]